MESTMFFEVAGKSPKGWICNGIKVMRGDSEREDDLKERAKRELNTNSWEPGEPLFIFQMIY